MDSPVSLGVSVSANIHRSSVIDIQMDFCRVRDIT